MKELNNLKKDFDQLRKSSPKKWDTAKELEKNGGVYIIYNKKEVIYVGSTNDFSKRFGNNMLHKGSHTLHRKLLKEKGNPEKVKKFLKEKCIYQIKEENDLRKRELLEHFAIVVLNPTYNKRHH